MDPLIVPHKMKEEDKIRMYCCAQEEGRYECSRGRKPSLFTKWMRFFTKVYECVYTFMIVMIVYMIVMCIIDT